MAAQCKGGINIKINVILAHPHQNCEHYIHIHELEQLPQKRTTCAEITQLTVS